MMRETMKIPRPVLIAYGILTIILLAMYVPLFPAGIFVLALFLIDDVSYFLLSIIWIFATGILIIIQSNSLTEAKSIGKMVYGYIFLTIGLALVLSGWFITIAFLWIRSGS